MTHAGVYIFLLQLVGSGQILFLASTRTVDVDRWERAFFSNSAIQMDLHVAGSLEFLVDNLVHLRPRINECRRENRQAAAFFDISRRAEEAFQSMQSIRVNTTGQDLA